MFEEANDLNYHYKNGYHITETKTLGIPALRDIKQFLLYIYLLYMYNRKI